MAYPINNTPIIPALSTEVFKISKENLQQPCFYSTTFKTFSSFKPDASNVHVCMYVLVCVCVCVCVYIYIYIYLYMYFLSKNEQDFPVYPTLLKQASFLE